MPDYRVSGEKKGDIWVKSGVIRSGNSRNPVFGFRLLGGNEEEEYFSKVSERQICVEGNKN